MQKRMRGCWLVAGRNFLPLELINDFSLILVVQGKMQKIWQTGAGDEPSVEFRMLSHSVQNR